MFDEIRFHGLELVEARLRQHADELDYVALDEVVSRMKRLPVARVSFTLEALAEYLDQHDDMELEDEEDIEDLPTEEGTSGLPSDLAEAADEPDDDECLEDDKGRMCRAVVAWIRAEAREILANRPSCTFRVQLYKPKGGYVESKNVRAENLSYRPSHLRQTPDGATLPPGESPSPPSPAPGAGSAATGQPQLPVVFQPQAPIVVQAPPVQVVLPASAPPPPRSTPAVALALAGDGQGRLIYLDPETIPEARVWRALGQATEEFLGTVGKTYGSIIELQARTVTHQSEQLDKSQSLVENLAGQLLAARQVRETGEAEQKADEQQLRIREELGKTFLSELGSFGRILASSRLGMAPEVAELGDLISTSPELTEAIRDPNVRAMLKDEKTRKELAQLLLLASKKPKAEGGAPPSNAA